MTEVPPPRYRIVERDRRLEVIDTWHGGARPSSAVRPALPTPHGNDPAPRLTTVKFDGTSILVTARWFDDKGPRRVTLSGETLQPLWVSVAVAAAVLIATAVFAPALLLGLAFVVSAKGRGALRAGATRWLDRNGA